MGDVVSPGNLTSLHVAEDAEDHPVDRLIGHDLARQAAGGERVGEFFESHRFIAILGFVKFARDEFDMARTAPRVTFAVADVFIQFVDDQLHQIVVGMATKLDHTLLAVEQNNRHGIRFVTQ